jgi:hypothetical protein
VGEVAAQRVMEWNGRKGAGWQRLHVTRVACVGD